ncbi:MAG TPA: amidohydrolase family protein [Acidobacteriota bacterium]|nr:amidohydrolase family protein [Acidobacteriota bacterium]
MRSLRLIWAALAAILCVAVLPAQSYVIQDARIVTVSGEVIERGSVVIEDGLISQVGNRVRRPRGATRIDGRGLTVYPGIFNADTSLGLTEIGQVAVTNDFSEMGEYSPQLLAWTAIHVESEHIPVARVDGITHAVTRPSGGTIAGQGAVVHLDGWSQEDMEIERNGAMYIELPEVLSLRSRRFGRGGGGAGGYKKAQEEFEAKTAELKELFARVKHYAQERDQVSVPDRQLEALIPLVEGRQLAVIEASSHADIKNAVTFAEETGLNYVILEADDAWRIPDFLKEHDVRVILGPRQSLPNRQDDSNDIIYETPRILEEAGVRFAIATGGSANARTLPFEVGNAVAYGLSPEEALRSITLTPAEFFGVDDRLGSVEEGKIANLVVTDGDIFEYQTQIKHLFIKGREVSLESKHTRLYDKYRKARN